MTFSDFTSFSQIEELLGVQMSLSEHLFPNVPDIAMPDYYMVKREENLELALMMNTEKARSEFIIAPLLVEAWRLQKSRVSFFSGIDLKVSPEEGLSGRCDFLFSATPDRLFPKAPILSIVEAKNDNVLSGLAQCAAEMIAAKKFNAAKGQQITTIYGCSTTGTEWRFLRLLDNHVFVDIKDYLISEPTKILSILVHILQTAH